MKISKIAKLCKQNGCLLLMDDPLRHIQWLSDSEAIYPMHGFPELEVDTLCHVMGLTDKEITKLRIEHIKLPETICFADNDDGEKPVHVLLSFFSGGDVLKSFTAGDNSLLLMKEKHLRPLFGGSERFEVFKRQTADETVEYFAVKRGMFLEAIILPTQRISDGMFKNISALADLARLHTQNRKSSYALQYSIDPDTGEIIVS